MSNHSVTRADVVALGIALLLLSCLLLPALAQSNSNAGKANCVNNLKKLILAVQNHHDTRLCLPMASTQPLDHKPGSIDAESAAGFGWLAMILPFMEQGRLAEPILAAMKAEKPAFDPGIAVSDTVINDLVCPSFKGDPNVIESESDYKALKSGKLPAISNYQALAGSHFFNAEGLGRMVPPDLLEKHTFAYEGDGAMPFPGAVGGKLQKRGLGFQSISDGTSNTIAIAETIEPGYSAWIDGQSTWLVAAWPGDPKGPTMQPNPANTSTQMVAWSDEDKKTAKVAVNLRNADGSPITYLPQGRWSGSKERKYAASSNHPEGVGHAYVDGHVEMISADVDPNVYIQLVTRNGREIIPDEFRRQQAEKMVQIKSGQQAVEIASSGGPAIDVVANQWGSAIDWSPLAVGDLRIRFPQILSSPEFEPVPNSHLLTFDPKSKVFELITMDRDKSEIVLYTNKEESPTAPVRLYKQLRTALGEPTSKEVNAKPKRIEWQKDAKWPNDAATFEFKLTEQSDDAPANIVIHFSPKK